MLDRTVMYELVYALAAKDGREDALFGTCAPLAREAFARSLAGEDFPEVWFELPLAGEPWFDLHVLTARETLRPGFSTAPNMDKSSAEALRWFARQNNEDVRQLALSYDVSSGDIDNPAIQLLVQGRGTTVPSEFLSTLAGNGAAAAYTAFARRIPQEWFACYSGVFPQRANMGIRVECIAERAQRTYAQDPRQLERDLLSVGLDTSSSTLLPWCAELAQLPFPIEFQFNVLPDGTVANTLGVSLRFAGPPGSASWHTFDPNGAAGMLMQRLEEYGLADDRWRLLSDTMFAKRVSRGNQMAKLSCFPAFVKLRWKDGQPLDAKTYLIACFSN